MQGEVRVRDLIWHRRLVNGTGKLNTGVVSCQAIVNGVPDLDCRGRIHITHLLHGSRDRLAIRLMFGRVISEDVDIK